MSRFSYLHSLATEAAQEFYGRDDYEAYGESEILPSVELGLEEQTTPQIRIPLGLMGRFKVNGDGMMSAFVSNGHNQNQAHVFGLANVEDAALTGQYLLGSTEWPVQFQGEEVEDFAMSDLSLDVKDSPVRLLAGIQVAYDANRDGLVPTLIYDRLLGSIAFRERAYIFSGLLAMGKSFEDVASDTRYSGNLAKAVMQPTEKNVDFFAETAAQAIVRDMEIDLG